jgi:hypothetical protein
MKVCAILICALVQGSATECQRGPGAYAIVDLEHVRTATGCRQVEADIRSGALPLPAGLRLVRRDMLPPKEKQSP